jgi:hypothetical protein
MSDLETTTVLSLAGDSVPLGSLWAEKPAVVAFLRHYG